MQKLKQESIKNISRMDGAVNIDDNVYKIYVIDKIRKGRKATKNEDMTSLEDLMKETASW